MKLKFLNVPLDLKAGALGDNGTFTGYGSMFGEVDSYREIVRKGAFAKSLKDWKGRGKMPAMLWQHDSKNPIGVWTSMIEDNIGLKVTGQLALDVPQGAAAYALLKMGAVDGLSIGYNATAWTDDKKTQTTTLDVIDLWEVSVVTFPAGPSARIDGVKSLVEHGKLPTLKEFEAALGELGFSNTQATAIAGKGLSYLIRQSESEGQKRELQMSEVLDLIKTT
jgi:HK97 family phage prohead protease